jgi:energy-coupling factor transport system permease protein
MSTAVAVRKVPSWGPRALPRGLHPGAWWLWGLGLMTAASRTENIAALALIVIACAFVVQMRRTDAPWARTFSVGLRIGAVLIVLRVVMQAVLAPAMGATVLFTLPSVALPSWVGGIRLGGMVTADSLMIGLSQGVRLATVIICIAAAASLASPTRLLRALPAAIYETGVAAVVSLTFLPQLVTDLQRVHGARRLRGRSTRGLRALAQTASTILDSSLERSVTLAAAMDSRGYGRRATVAAGERRMTDGLLLGGLVGIVLGTYGAMDSGTSASTAIAVMLIGLACAFAGLVMAGRRSTRTRHRRDPWRGAEWAVAGSGAVVATLFLLFPPVWPGVGPVALIAMLVAGTPALTSPPPSTSNRGVLT